MYRDEQGRMGSVIEWMLEEWPLQSSVAGMLERAKRERLLGGMEAEEDLERDRR
jgi:hypothetical protein